MAHQINEDGNEKGDPSHLVEYRWNEGNTTGITYDNDNVQQFVGDVEINRPKARTYAANNNDDAAERRNNIRSPRIRNIGWGCVDVEDIGIFKDVKLYPGGADPWDWKITDTHHKPGIQPGDVRDLISHQCEIIILSSGMHNMLHTSDEARQLLEENGMKLNKTYFILESKEAVRRYNDFAEANKNVGALIHSTC